MRKQIAEALAEGTENLTTERVLRTLFWQPRPPRIAEVAQFAPRQHPASKPPGRV